MGVGHTAGDHWLPGQDPFERPAGLLGLLTGNREVGNIPEDLAQIRSNPLFAKKADAMFAASIRNKGEGGFWTLAPNGTRNLAGASLRFVGFPDNFQYNSSVQSGPVPIVNGYTTVAHYHAHWLPRHVNGPALQDIAALRNIIAANPSVIDGFVGRFDGIHTYRPR